MAEQKNVLMEKGGEQIGVPTDKVENYRLLGWKEVIQTPPVQTPPSNLFTEAERREIAKIVAAELVKSSLTDEEQKAVAEVRKTEEKIKAAEEKAKAEAAAAAEKATKEAEAAAKKAAAAAKKAEK